MSYRDKITGNTHMIVRLGLLSASSKETQIAWGQDVVGGTHRLFTHVSYRLRHLPLNYLRNQIHVRTGQARMVWYVAPGQNQGQRRVKTFYER